MSGRYTSYHGITVEIEGRLTVFGNPRGGSSYTIPGERTWGGRPDKLDGGALRELWKYTTFRDFEKVKVRLYEGNATLYWWCDTPVSAGDLTPSGLNTRIMNHDLDCNDTFTLSSDSCRINTSLAVQNAIVGGVPQMWGHVNTLQGKIYGIWLGNLGADAIGFEALVIN